MLVVAALGYVALTLSALVLYLSAQILRIGRRRSDVAVGQVRSMHWSVVLLHASRDHDVEALIRQGIQLTGADVVVVPEVGVAPMPGRAHVRERPEAHELSSEPPALVVSLRDAELPVPDGRGYWRWTDLVFFLVGTLIFVLGLAAVVPAWEQGQPLGSYGPAVYWSLTRVISGGDPNGLGPSSWQNEVLATLLSIYGVYVLVAIVGQIVQRQAEEDRASGPELVARYNEHRQARHPVTPTPTARSKRPSGAVAGRAWEFGQRLQQWAEDRAHRR